MHSFLNSLCFSAVFLAGVIFDEHALVPVGSVLAVLGGVWWLGRKLQNMDDRLERLKRIEDRLDNLACQKPQDCEKKPK